MRRLPAHNFRIDNHCGSNYISIFSLWDSDKDVPMSGWKLVGYTMASAVQFRATKDGYAIMLERVKAEDAELAPWHNDKIGEWIWMHLSILPQKKKEQ